MANAVFGWPIYSDDSVSYVPALSAGSWQTTLPLTNLKDRRLGKVARSTNALATSTQFQVDLGIARSVRVFALPKHNISSVGTIRVRGSNTAGNFGTPVYDSGTLTIWPTGLTAEDIFGLNLGWTRVASSAQIARYWLFEIVDTGNVDGYIELGRLVIAGAWQPTYNISYGNKLGVETATERIETDGGAAQFYEKATRRTQVGVFENLPEDESLREGLDMMRLLGTSKQLMWIFDPDDVEHMWRRSFLAVMRTLSPIDYPYYNRHNLPFELVEEL